MKEKVISSFELKSIPKSSVSSSKTPSFELKLMPKRFSYSVSPALVECSNHQAECGGQISHTASLTENIRNG